MKKLIAASLFLLMLGGCSNYGGQIPTVDQAPTFTSSPVQTPTLESTVTAMVPTDTPLVVSSPRPEGEPVAEWNGIPIMPGAITGEGDEEGYVFTIDSSSQQVQDFYNLELAALGWLSLSQGTEGSSRVLVFSNNASGTVTVSILARGDETLVLLTR